MLPTRKCNHISHMALETALQHMPSRTQVVRSRVGPSVPEPHYRVHARPVRERGLPVSVREPCNRTHSVIRWPALCALALCPNCLTLPLSPSSSHLSLSSHHCSISDSSTAQYPPLHPLPFSTAEMANYNSPTLSLNILFIQPTHVLSSVVLNRLAKSTRGQCQNGHITPMLAFLLN